MRSHLTWLVVAEGDHSVDSLSTSIVVSEQCSAITYGFTERYSERREGTFAKESNSFFICSQPEFVARQSLYSLDGYTGQTGSPGAHGYSSSLNPGDSPPPSRRPSSMMQQSWSAEEQGEEDVLIIPSSNARR